MKEKIFKRKISGTIVDQDEDNLTEGDEGDEGQLQAIKRTVETKFAKLEGLLNRKMIKGLQSLATDTKARLTQLQTETKVKMNHV